MSQAKTVRAIRFTICAVALTHQSPLQFVRDDVSPGCGAFARDDEDIGCRRQIGAVAPKVFANPSLDAIARHRVPDLAADRYP